MHAGFDLDSATRLGHEHVANSITTQRAEIVRRPIRIVNDFRREYTHFFTLTGYQSYCTVPVAVTLVMPP